MEILGHKSHLILAERPEFVHTSMTASINEVKELLFSLGPLSAYLFRTFSDAMLSQLDDAVRKEVVAEANELIASGGFFDTAKAPPSDDSACACEPDMQDALRPSVSLNIRPESGFDQAWLLCGGKKAGQDHQDKRSGL